MKTLAKSKIYEGNVVIRMTNGYGIATNYSCKNECPYDKTPLKKTGENFGCYDGVWTTTDKFTCEKNCLIQYRDIIKYNGYER